MGMDMVTRRGESADDSTGVGVEQSGGLGQLFHMDETTVRALQVRVLRWMTCVDLARAACVCRLFQSIVAKELNAPCLLPGCLQSECLRDHTVDFTWAPRCLPPVHRFEESDPSRLVVSNPTSLASVLARLREARERYSDPPRGHVTALEVYRVYPRPLLVATYERRPVGYHLYVEGGVDSYSDPRAGDAMRGGAEAAGGEGLRCLVLHCGQEEGNVHGIARTLADECGGLLLLHVEGHEVPLSAPHWTHVLACLSRLREVKLRCLCASGGDTDARPWDLCKALLRAGHPSLRRVLIEAVPADARAGRGREFWAPGAKARLRWASHAVGILLASPARRQRMPHLRCFGVEPSGGWDTD